MNELLNEADRKILPQPNEITANYFSVDKHPSDQHIHVWKLSHADGGEEDTCDLCFWKRDFEGNEHYDVLIAKPKKSVKES